jgi:hypothetical protein
MSKINWTRMFLGGLLAGVIINLFEFVTNGVVLRREWAEAMKALGRSAMAPTAVVVFVIWGFLVGISAIWLYAAARPRFGPGVKTAALTGFAFWVFGYALPTLGNWALGLFPKRLLVIGVLVGLVEVILASVAGAWLYKEGPSA